MPLPAQGEGFKKTPEEQLRYNNACPETGSYFARINKFLHVGTVKGMNFAQEEAWTNKFKLGVELVTAPLFVFDEKKGPQPWTAAVESTYSTGEKSNLYKYINNIYKADKNVMSDVAAGKFQPSRLINQLVMITTVKKMSAKGNAYIKITGITAPMEMAGLDLTGYRTSKLYNACVVFDIDEFLAGNPVDREAFKALYKFEQEMIAGSQEFTAKGLRLEDFQTQDKAVSQQGYQQQPAVQAQYQPAMATAGGFGSADEDEDVF